MYININNGKGHNIGFVQISEDELDEYTYTTNGDVEVLKCNFEYLTDDYLDTEKEISIVVDYGEIYQNN